MVDITRGSDPAKAGDVGPGLPLDFQLGGRTDCERFLRSRGVQVQRDPKEPDTLRATVYVQGRPTPMMIQWCAHLDLVRVLVILPLDEVHATPDLALHVAAVNLELDLGSFLLDAPRRSVYFYGASCLDRSGCIDPSAMATLCRYAVEQCERHYQTLRWEARQSGARGPRGSWWNES